jgi:hypothetical protein
MEDTVDHTLDLLLDMLSKRDYISSTSLVFRTSAATFVNAVTP